MRLVLLIAAACTSASAPKEDAPATEDTEPADSDVVDTDAPVAEESDDPGAVETDTASVADTGPFGTSRIEVTATADDVWELWIDGRRVRLPDGATAWWEVNTFTLTRPGSRHVVAIRARDTQQVVAGLLAEVVVNGEVVARTGDFGFVATGTPPPSDWAERDFDDSTWTPPSPCAPEDQAVWGRVTAAHGVLLDAGATWVWSRPCRGDLGGTWFRVVIGPRATP
jgi:hypothetical protein